MKILFKTFISCSLVLVLSACATHSSPYRSTSASTPSSEVEVYGVIDVGVGYQRQKFE